MAFTTELNNNTGFFANLGQRFSAFRAAQADRAARNRAFRTTRDELSAMSDRDLADLGLSRFQIEDVAREAARLA